MTELELFNNLGHIVNPEGVIEKMIFNNFLKKLHEKKDIAKVMASKQGKRMIIMMKSMGKYQRFRLLMKKYIKERIVC